MSGPNTPQFEEAVKQEVELLSRQYPTPDDIPGCIKLFDQAIVCNTATSQVRSLYRYGHMAECSQKWTDFKFCLALRVLSAEERRVAWIRHRAEWWATRRTTGSSEDVWEVRKEPLTNFPPPPSQLGPDEIIAEIQSGR